MANVSNAPQFRFCAICGQKHGVGDRFCATCGSLLCMFCGATARQAAKFCLRCGKPLALRPTPPPEMPGESQRAFRGPLPQSRPLDVVKASPWLIEFVDRQEVVAAFNGLVSGMLDTKRIMLLRGSKGMGKSFLLRRLQVQCQQSGVPHVRIEMADPRGVDDIKIMRDVRDGLGADDFKPFTDLLNYYTTEGYTLKLQVEVIDHSGRQNSSVTIQDQASVAGVVAGRDAIVIRDNYLSAPRRDIEVDRRRMQDALTRRFLEGLISVSSRQLAVCLFDDIDQLEPTTAFWLWRDFLGQMLNQSGFVAVLAAVSPPPVDRWVSSVIEEAPIGRMPEAYVTEYLERRGVPQDDRKGVAGIIVKNFSGNPDEMARVVDIYLKPRPGAVS